MVGILLVGAGGLAWTSTPLGDSPAQSSTGPAAITAPDMRGDTVALEAGVTAAPPEVSRAVADIGERFAVPAVGLDVPLGSLDVVGDEITPPGFTSAYWVGNLGVAVDGGTQGTVFVVMHALSGGGLAPGNFLVDPDHETAKVSPGDMIEVAGISYHVSGSEVIAKTDLPGHSEVWASVPGRLVIITCLARPNSGSASSNVVIYADRLPTP